MGENRTERICTTPSEKEQLSDIREDVFGTDSVPLSETVTYLMEEYNENN